MPSRLRPHLALLAALGAAALGCGRLEPAELLPIASVGPSRLSVGTSLRVEGEGFPVGRVGELTLEGSCQRPGALPHAVEVRLPITAHTALEAGLTLDRARLERFGLRATCRTDATVRFEGPSRDVVGRRADVEFDVVPTGRDRIVGRLEDRTRAREVATSLGLVFGEAPPDAGGLPVVDVARDSAGARAGLLAGDVVVAIDGAHVLDLPDFLPTPGLRRTQLEVLGRDGSRRTVLAPSFVSTEAESESALGHALVALAVLLLLAFAGPLARITHFVSASPPRDPEATLDWLFGTRSGEVSRRARVRRVVVTALGALGISAAFVGISVVGQVLQHDFGIGILLSASLAVRIAARVYGEADAAPAPYLPFFLASAPLTVVVLAVSILIGTGHLGELHAVQGPYPPHWLVFANPIAFALFPVFAATALTRVEPEGTSSGLSQVAARAHLLLVSALGCVLFLGGYCPALGSPVLGVVLFVVKCWALMGLGLWVRSVSRKLTAETFHWTVPVALLGLAGSAVYSAVDVPSFVVRGSGYVLSILAGAVLVYVLARRLRPVDDVAVLHPFL